MQQQGCCLLVRVRRLLTPAPCLVFTTPAAPAAAAAAAALLLLLPRPCGAGESLSAALPNLRVLELVVQPESDQVAAVAALTQLTRLKL